MDRVLVAVALLAVAGSACSVAGEGKRADEPPAVPERNPVDVVAEWVEARNAGDWETQAALSSPDILKRGFGSHDEMLAAVELDRRVRLDDCSVTLKSATVGSFVACEVSVTDIILDAAAVVATNLNQITFVVVDGIVVKVPQWLPSSHIAEQAVEEWGMMNDERRYRSACPNGIAGQEVVTGLDCARWIADTRAGWVEAVGALGLK